MKLSPIGLLAPALLAIGATSAAADFKRISDEAVFRSVIADKRLTAADGGGHVTVKSNGQLSGRFDNQRLVGAWVWRRGHFCRRVQLGNNEPREACQKVHATNSRVRFTTTQNNRVTEYTY